MMREITGKTRVFATLADPIGHVRAPAEINALAAARDRDAVMVPLHVAAGGLSAALDGLRAMRNLGGFIVTVPHKTAIVPLLDRLGPAARRVGAVNVVRRETDGALCGEMLDGTGFVAGLRAGGHDPAGRSVYLAGSGGAAAAIAFALAEAGIAHLTLSNRTVARVEALAVRLRETYPRLPVVVGSRDPSGHDIVVNATSQGLKADDALPLDVDALTENQLVAEIIMQPAETALMLAAARRGCRVHPGLPMLRCQLDLMADWMGLGVEKG